MADDIRFSVNFWQHPKTVKLSRKGGLEAVRSLQILWCFCAQERTDGILSGMDIDDIEIAADWRGEPGRLVELLLAGNWLEQFQEGTYALHGWEERQAYVSKKKLREEQAKAAAEIRWRKKRGVTEPMPEDAPQDAAHMPGNDAHTAPHMPDSDSAYADSCEQHCSLQNEHMLTHAQRNAPAPDPFPDPDPKGINTPPLPPTGESVAEDAAQSSPAQPDAPKKKRREPTGNSLPELRQAIDGFTVHEPLRNALEAFRAMRERMRKPLTGRALELTFRELEKLAPNNPALQVEIVNQSIMRGWQGVFELKGPVQANHVAERVLSRNAETTAAVLAARRQGRRAYGNDQL